MVAAKAWFKAKHPAKIPAAFYGPIGRLIAAWTFTELYMQSIAWHVLKIRAPKVQRLMTWGRNAVEQTKLFYSLNPDWIPDPADRAEHEAIHAEAERLRAQRNKLAHGVWGYKPGERPRSWRLFYLRENDLKLRPKALVITPAEVKRWADDLDALNIRLKAFHRRLGAAVP